MRTGYLLCLIACSGTSQQPGQCTPGASQACTCTNGRSGAQTCQPDGTFGACSCTGGMIDAPVADTVDSYQPIMGVDWAKAGTAAFGGRADFSYTLHSGQEWVVGGVNNSGTFTDAWSSSDATTWTASTGNAMIGGLWAGCVVSFNGALWMVNNSAVYTSADGITWTSQGSAPSGFTSGGPGTSITACAVWNSKWWLIGTNSIGAQPVWSTPDGTTWTETSTGYATGASVEGAVVVGSELVLATTNGIYGSTDGATWTPKTLSFHAVGPTIIVNNTLWAFSSNNFALAKSTDGVNWTEVTANLPWRDTIVSPNTSMQKRSLFAFFAYGSPAKLYIVGGEEGYHSMTGQVGTQYDSDIWVSPP